MMLPGLRPNPPATDEQGTLESVIWGRGIEQGWLEKTGGAGFRRVLRATDIFDLAISGDNKARELLHGAAELLAMAITNLSLVMDLFLVVLSGGVGTHAGLLEPFNGDSNATSSHVCNWRSVT